MYYVSAQGVDERIVNVHNYETELINCLIVCIILFVCGIVVFICVGSIASTGC